MKPYQIHKPCVIASMRIILGFLLTFAFFLHASAQDKVYGEKRERHKVWKNWKSHRQSYNPYLDRKGKDKPSSKMARADKKYIKRANKNAKRQMRHSRKNVGKKGKNR
jgi:hypothetical protein